MDRRSFLATGGAIAAATSVGAMSARASSAEKLPLSMHSDGTYDTVPLAKDAWTLAVVQSRVLAVDTSNYRTKRRDNVQHMCDLIDYANGFSGRKDLMFFHEFPITGYNYKLNAAETRAIAIEVPGEETEMLAKKAREHGIWLVFGSYVRDRDWPDSVLSMTTIMNDRGEIVDKHWKARNIKGAFGGQIELFTTTIYDVYDRYVEMYGIDRVVPITRTPLGNIATSSVQREPELFRAMAMKGAEVILRTASGGFSALDMQATSLYNQLYTAVANNAASPGNGLFFEDAGGGGSAIYGPDGETIASAPTAFETNVTTRIPIRDFRARHRQPLVHSELVMPVYEAYRSRYAPGLFSKYQPKDLKDSARYLADKSRWAK